ncbi:hypothetical protein SAMN04487848_2379 [Microbacterium sp. ru370.1]|uniref:DUF2200 domain-containing protein n=1 Tax=unclassified Microbacterium TaxID=2609290 RepID=UPI00088A366E|nr:MULTISPECIES: DUF2200 domain-containing protein [unclassified Microbacterium]SDO83904.1 hypothetical protein SAMN04487848_2379 [Microbacterium sp. ru370.1]SIT90274.1 hypothetical protein SAMN05880579_2374 [Microbacterium sp. RU1D]
MSRVFDMAFSSVYPLYLAKVERKGRTKEELDAVIRWLTGFDDSALLRHIEGTTSFRAFFDEATLSPHASQVTGVVCGIRVEEIDDPLMYRIRVLDKLVDELAKGRPLAKILRGGEGVSSPAG